MRRLFCKIIFLFLFFTGLSNQALACSLTADFFGLSNFELVAEADVIAIAKASSVEKNERSSGLVFDVSEILKGDKVRAVKKEYGYVVEGLDKTPKDTLDTLHPSAMEGACSRSAFEIGERYIVMISKSERGHFVMGYPFERNASDYHGADSLWRRAVDYYIEVQSNPDTMAQLEQLRADHRLLDASDDPMDKLLAADIEDHLTSISPLMPTEHLIGLYKAVQTLSAGNIDLRAPTGNPEYEAHPELALIDEMFGTARNEAWDRDAVSQRILLAISEGEHPEALPFMKVKADAPGAQSLYKAYVIKMLASAELWDEMIERVDPFVFELMSAGSKPAASEIMNRVRGAMKPWSDTPVWKDSERLTEWYPDFSVRFARANTRLGEKTGLPDGIEDIVRPKDYRADPELTLIFAEDFDRPVRAWARKEIERLLVSEENAFSKAFILPLQVLLADYQFDESESFTDIFCHVEKGRAALIRATALMKEEYFREDILERLAVSEMDDEDREYLILSMMTDAGEKWTRYAGGKGWMDDDLVPVIASLQAGEIPDIDAEPISCGTPEP